jgi:hypothetical protein
MLLLCVLPCDPSIHSHAHSNSCCHVTNESRLTIDMIQIVSKIHTLAATYRAVNDLLQNRLKSRNVHSEIVFSLSPNNNVRSSLASSSPFRYPPFCFFRLVPPCSKFKSFFVSSFSSPYCTTYYHHFKTHITPPVPFPPIPTMSYSSRLSIRQPSYLKSNTPHRSPNPSAASV